MTEYKYSTLSVSELLKEYNYNLMEGQEYVSIKEKMKIVDNDGYKYFVSLDCFLTNLKNKSEHLHKFFTGNIFTLNNIELWLMKNHKKFSFISGEYLGARERNLIFSCNNCGEKWNTSWNDISRNHGCPICSVLVRSEKRKIPLEDVLKTFKDNNIIIIDPSKYIDTESKVFCICKKCKHEWETDYHHVRNGKGCPKCKSSHGEKLIQKFLDSKNISYKSQKRFDGCMYKKHLPFDFYLLEYDACIEYHGEQHYKPIDYFGGNEHLNGVLMRDSIKRNFCQENNIRLLEISYLDYDNVEKIVSNFLDNSKFY